MTKRILFLLAIGSIFWSCGEESEPEDCAGVTDVDAVINGIPIKWIRTYDGDESWCVNTVSDGGFIIAGATNYTGLIIKTDLNGEKEWHQLYDNSTSLYRVRQTADGGFITTGRESTGWTVPWAPVSISQSLRQPEIVKRVKCFY